MNPGLSSPLPMPIRQAFLLSSLAILSLSISAYQVEALPEVQPVDLNSLSPSDFTDSELDIPWSHGPNQPLPYYLKHFHRLANAVVSEGENKGFIDISVWRHQRDNRPYNARILENILSLAFFYATDRPWNPYYGDAAVRDRLDAALMFWVNSQNDDGRFSEYDVNRWNLAATAFAAKFMAETLELLEGKDVNPRTMRQVWQAQRKAIMGVLDNEASYRHGMRFSNQFGNVWPAAIMYLQNHTDREMERALLSRLESGKTSFQSPAGFFYESNAPDWGYAFGTHFSNMIAAWHYARDTKWAPYFVEEVDRWTEWFSYNAYPEPGNKIFTLNRAIQTRQTRGFLRRLEVSMSEVVPLLRAWAPIDDEIEERQSAIRNRVNQTWPEQETFRVGGFSSFSPYAFLHRRHYSWSPSQAERELAIGQLPFHSQNHFSHQRVDNRNPLVYTFIKRSGYYTIFNSGEKVRNRTRHGIGLLAHPTMGTVLQSHDGSDRLFWGTRGRQQEMAYENDSLDAHFYCALKEQRFEPEPGNRNLPDNFYIITYPLGEKGTKEITFTDDAVVVEIEYADTFTEQLPLLIPGNPEILPDGKGLRVQIGDTILLIQTKGAEAINIEEPGFQAGPIDGIIGFLGNELDWNNPEKLLNGKRPLLVEIEANQTLVYAISIVENDSESY